MKKVYLAALAVCTAFASCSNDGNDENGATPAGEPCSMYLTLASATPRGITDSFVAATTDESAVNVLEFYVFDSSGNPDTEVGRLNDTTPGAGYISKTVVASNIYSITVTAGTNKKIVAVINSNLGALTTNTYAGLKAEMAKLSHSAANARVEARMGGFEMSGEKEFTISAPQTSTISIDVARVASRINAPAFTTGTGFVDLDNAALEEIWGTNYASDLFGKTLGFQSDGYVVINGRDKSDMFFIGNTTGNDRDLVTIGGGTISVPDWGTWSGTGKACINSTFNSSGFYTGVYSGACTDPGFFLDATATGEHRVYVYENKPDFVTGNAGYEPATTYALVVKGTFLIDGSNTDGLCRTRYWRINLTNDDDYHIYRNASYAITVNKITTPGYGNPKDAEDEVVVPRKDQSIANVTIVVSQWRSNTYSTQI